MENLIPNTENLILVLCAGLGGLFFGFMLLKKIAKMVFFLALIGILGAGLWASKTLVPEKKIEQILKTGEEHWDDASKQITEHIEKNVDSKEVKKIAKKMKDKYDRFAND